VSLCATGHQLIRMRRTGRSASDPVVQHCKALLDLLFLEVTPPRKGVITEGRVVSFTRTEDEISLIIPEHFESQFRTVRSLVGCEGSIPNRCRLASSKQQGASSRLC
jgi:hypothetical protein